MAIGKTCKEEDLREGQKLRLKTKTEKKTTKLELREKPLYKT